MVDNWSGFVVEVLCVELAAHAICPLISGRRTGRRGASLGVRAGWVGEGM